MHNQANDTAHGRRLAASALILLLLAATGTLLAACGAATRLNPFKEEEARLPGERLSIARVQEGPNIEAEGDNKPVALPAPSPNEAWSQPGGNAANAPGHLAFTGSLRTLWSADAGDGSSDNGRLIASPIVYQGRVYTLDTEGALSAFAASGGSRIWRVSLVPEGERGREGYGGGIAADEGRLFVTTGFGTAVALNPANGEVLWTKKIGQPIRTSPTVAGGKMFFVTSESELYGLNTADGEEVFKHRGTPESATLLGNVSPAISGGALVVPYPSGDVIAYDIEAKQPLWVESVAGRRANSAFASMRDPARPVIEGGVVFAAGHSGRLIATTLKKGERLWTKNLGSTQTPAAAGEAVFVFDASDKVLALGRKDGKVRWIADLPEANKWNGPVLAGGKLWLVSDKGLLVGVDGQSGQTVSQRNLDTEVLIAPIVAGGRMYILTDSAQLLALD